ncbi:MAG: DNA topoisomerase I [Candidatus Bathyarchaeota archaeon]|nr:DNA topoisomerase I [Candidatus Bathyarchaeota archaeon]
MELSYTLIIAEKPNVAFRIAQALADGKPEKIERNGAPYYVFTANGRKHVCAPAVGHLFVLSAVKDDGNKGWTYPVFSYEWVPTYEKRETRWTEKYYKNIEELAKEASDFVDAADLDAEGEVLLFNILRFLCGVKDAKRMKFSTLTKDELISAYKNMSPHILTPMLESGLTRHELDWLFGINITRALTLALKNHAIKGFTILSTGRVQGPTLATLLDRETSIRKFKPKQYWQLELHCLIDGTKIVGIHETARFWRREDADRILEKCRGKDARVKGVARRQYRKKPPAPFNTTDLQTEVYNHFKYSPRQTLNISESLYQQGFISYPRTASQRLPPSINYEKILKTLMETRYSKLAADILKRDKLTPHEGRREDPAHPAIYPTFEPPKWERLNRHQKRVYDLIVRRFFAAFGHDAVRETVSVNLEIEDNKFKVVGTRTVEEGWVKFYKPYISFKEQALPRMEEGQTVKVEEIELLEKETKPPDRFTQGSILKEMEKRGLGTRATRAEILQTLYDRNYISGKSIQVTKLGETVVKELKEACPRILSEELTRQFEKEMELVYDGRKKREDVVEEAKYFLKNILEDFKRNEEKIGKKLLEGLLEARRDERRLGACLKCGGELRIIRSKRTGLFFVGCSNYPKCTNSYPLPHNAKIVKTSRVCEKCGTPIVRVVRRGKRPFNMCLDPNCETKKDWKKKLKQKTKT